MRNGNQFIERITELLNIHSQLDTPDLHSKLIRQLNGRGRPYRNNLTMNQLTNVLSTNFRKINKTHVKGEYLVATWTIREGEEE